MTSFVEQILFDYFSVLPRKKVGSSCLVACSGGPDSVALALAVKALQEKNQIRFSLVHINHGLRGRSSDLDEAFVARLAKKLDLPFHSKKVALSSRSGNLEERARVKRYEALVKLAEKKKSRLILTAHTLDDQAETILMNISRGAGLAGLSGMDLSRNLNKTICLGRPFLSLSKKDLVAYLRKRRQSYRLDRSNKDQSYLRSWLRHRLIPTWASRTPHLGTRLSELASIVQAEEQYWGPVIKRQCLQLTRPFKSGRLVDFQVFRKSPVAVQRRVLREISGLDLLTFEMVERLRAWMASPPSQGLKFQLRKGWVCERLSKSKGAPSTNLFWFHQKKVVINKGRKI